MREVVHPVIEADLHGFVDGQLSAERRAEVMAHLVDHPETAFRVENWRNQNERLIAAFGHVALEPLPVALSLSMSAAARYTAAPSGIALLPRPVADVPHQASQRFAPAPPQIFSSSWCAGFLMGLAVAAAVGGAALLVAQRWNLSITSPAITQAHP